MPAHHSQIRKLQRAARQQKTRLCRFFNTEEGCANGASCSFAHGAEEFRLPPLAKDVAFDCSSTDDSTSVCSEETSVASLCSSVQSTGTASSCGVSPFSARQCWADVDEDDDDWQSVWAPQPEPKMHKRSIPSSNLPPSDLVELNKRTVKTQHREQAAEAARAKRAMLTGAVLEGLLRQAQMPYVYED